MNRPPQATKCQCGRMAAETICSLCKTERAELIEVKCIAEAIRQDAEHRANDYANDRIKADKISPPYSHDADLTVFGATLRPGQ